MQIGVPVQKIAYDEKQINTIFKDFDRFKTQWDLDRSKALGLVLKADKEIQCENIKSSEL